MNYLIPVLAKSKPVLVLDVTGEYEGKIYQDFDEFFRYVKTTGGIEKGVHVLRWKKQETAIRLIHFVRKMEVPVSLVLEEAHILFNDSELHKAVKTPLRELCFLGRHFAIDTILCSQRPASLPPNVRSQAQFFVSFKQKERADIDYLRQKSETAVKVAELKQKQFFSIGEQPKGFSEIKINEVNQL